MNRKPIVVATTLLLLLVGVSTATPLPSQTPSPSPSEMKLNPYMEQLSQYLNQSGANMFTITAQLLEDEFKVSNRTAMRNIARAEKSEPPAEVKQVVAKYLLPVSEDTEIKPEHVEDAKETVKRVAQVTQAMIDAHNNKTEALQIVQRAYKGYDSDHNCPYIMEQCCHYMMIDGLFGYNVLYAMSYYLECCWYDMWDLVTNYYYPFYKEFLPDVTITDLTIFFCMMERDTGISHWDPVNQRVTKTPW